MALKSTSFRNVYRILWYIPCSSFEVPQRLFGIAKLGVHSRCIDLSHKIVRIDRQRARQPRTCVLPVAKIGKREGATM